ncbi:hypothetical protein L208DRAFT_1522161 [Tricholoma matsutake]|nr:hypothetical protein L208DRAFT_1522161 [Tricholoma matsutake 945]
MYKDVMLFFSQDATLTIAHVIPTMDFLDLMLNDDNPNPLSLSVKHMLKFAHTIINKY